MPDINITFDQANQVFDWTNFATLSAPATADFDLENAVVLSLFTDRIAPANYVGDHRGTWTDTYDGLLGSRLWMLNRSKTTGALQRAHDYCTEALAWIIGDKISDKIDINTYWIDSTALGIVINVLQPHNKAPRVFNFSYLWRSL